MVAVAGSVNVTRLTLSAIYPLFIVMDCEVPVTSVQGRRLAVAAIVMEPGALVIVILLPAVNAAREGFGAGCPND
jgi:hypothetical protein